MDNTKKELIDIVNENGEFTGQIMDKDEAHAKNLLHNEVACFIVNDKRQVLLQKRSANKKFNPSKWALCAGHVDAGESLISAQIREIKEEVGLDVFEDDLIPFAEREFTIRDSNSHITYFYYVKCNLKENDFTIQKEELSEVKWFDIDELMQMILNHDESTVFDENRLPLLKLLKEEIK